MKQLSILIPTYNGVCTQLVDDLHRQAEALSVDYEILVADDGSDDFNVIEANRSINRLPHCQLLEQKPNRGRSAIRNFLARQARYPWLLFIDSDMVVCRNDFLKRYADTSDYQRVVDGGIIVRNTLPHNLRSLYEKAAEGQHTADLRQRSPYQHLHTANLLVKRETLLRHPFDERFRHYGYEDVLLGKQFCLSGVHITHIDNPLSFEVFEENAHFISKTEEGLRTLHDFSDELQGYSSLLTLAGRLRPVAPLIRLWHLINKGWERSLLTSPHPSLLVFNLYRLGYFFSL